MSSDDLDGFTLQELQQRLGVDERTLRNWIRRLDIEPTPNPLDARRRIVLRNDAKRLERLATMSTQFSSDTDPLSALLNDYGPFSSPAADTLKDALQLADKTPLVALHVVLAALHREWRTPPAESSPMLAKVLTDPTVRFGLEAAISMRMELDTAPVGEGDWCSAQMRQYLLRAQARAERAPISFALLIWTISVDDPDVQLVFKALPPSSSIDRAALTRELETLIQPRVTGSQPAVVVRLAQPSPGHLFAPRHHATMKRALENLATRSHDQLVICEGLPGTPLDVLESVLTDMVASRETSAFDDRLDRYQHVIVISIARVRALEGIMRQQTPADLFAQSLAAASQEHAIVLITQLELLLRDEPIDRSLLSVLASPGEAAVIALYRQANEAAPSASVAFPNLDALVTTIPAYPEGYTKNVIRKYFDWTRDAIDTPREGMEPAELERTQQALAEALETLFLLEPAILVNGRRKTTPYVAVDLLQQTVRTIKTSARPDADPELLKSIALSAEQELEELIHSKAAIQTIVLLKRIKSNARYRGLPKCKGLIEQWEKRLDALEPAQKELQALAASPRLLLGGDSGRYLITRGMVNAHLFGSHVYQFDLTMAFAFDLKKNLPDEIVAEILAQ